MTGLSNLCVQHQQMVRKSVDKLSKSDPLYLEYLINEKNKKYLQLRIINNAITNTLLSKEELELALNTKRAIVKRLNLISQEIHKIKETYPKPKEKKESLVKRILLKIFTPIS